VKQTSLKSLKVFLSVLVPKKRSGKSATSEYINLKIQMPVILNVRGEHGWRRELFSRSLVSLN
jgi:hypothetical protein